MVDWLCLRVDSPESTHWFIGKQRPIHWRPPFTELLRLGLILLRLLTREQQLHRFPLQAPQPNGPIMPSNKNVQGKPRYNYTFYLFYFYSSLNSLCLFTPPRSVPLECCIKPLLARCSVFAQEQVHVNKNASRGFIMCLLSNGGIVFLLQVARRSDYWKSSRERS